MSTKTYDGVEAQEIVLYGIHFNPDTCEISEDNENPEEFAVYVRVRESDDFCPLNWLADLDTYPEALAFALGFQSQVDVPIFDHFAIDNHL